MFEVITDTDHYKKKSYEELKRIEAMCRGFRQSYKIIYPDGAILECRFTNDTSLHNRVNKA